jgi:hypothetical protein
MVAGAPPGRAAACRGPAWSSAERRIGRRAGELAKPGRLGDHDRRGAQRPQRPEDRHRRRTASIGRHADQLDGRVSAGGVRDALDRARALERHEGVAIRSDADRHGPRTGFGRVGRHVDLVGVLEAPAGGIPVRAPHAVARRRPVRDQRDLVTAAGKVRRGIQEGGRPRRIGAGGRLGQQATQARPYLSSRGLREARRFSCCGRTRPAHPAPVVRNGANPVAPSVFRDGRSQFSVDVWRGDAAGAPGRSS